MDSVEDVILETCIKEGWVNMVDHVDSSNESFYMHILVIYDLGMLIPFTVFESKVLTIINVAHFMYHLQ